MMKQHQRRSLISYTFIMLFVSFGALSMLMDIVDASSLVIESSTGIRGVIVDLDGEKHCDPGYHMEGDGCQPNECSCDNGIVATGEKCEEDNTEICTTCDDGYNLQDDRCKHNQCDCDNGLGTFGDMCPVHGSDLCDPNGCNAGHRFIASNSTCKENICVCKNGTPATGAKCDEDGKNVCEDCNGYYLEQDEDLCKFEAFYF